jgi:hypothetical protein
MNKHFDHMTNLHRGCEPRQKTIALREADTRALGMEEIV